MNLIRVGAIYSGMSTPHKPYPSDVSEEEWAFAAPYLTLVTATAHHHRRDLRHVFDALRWVINTGAQWRYLPHDFPPWPAVHQHARRWLAAGCLEAMAHDLRELVRVAAGRTASPTAAILDGRTIQSTPESGSRAGYGGPRRRTGSTPPSPWTLWAICWLGG